jgi:predicted Holliday junction resolvase-like endonuclease
MEILSFILGIAFVVVIAMSIVAVYAFVKVNKLRKELDEMQRDICQNLEEVYRQMAQRNDEIIRTLDSRCDKLENKLTNNK